MRRKLFPIAAAVSAVLCVGVCALWVRSYRVGDFLEWESPINLDAVLHPRHTMLYLGEGGAHFICTLGNTTGPEDARRAEAEQLVRIRQSQVRCREAVTARTRRDSLPAGARWGFF